MLINKKESKNIYKTFIKSSRRRGANSNTRLKSLCRAGDKTADSRVNCFCIKSSACCRKQKELASFQNVYNTLCYSVSKETNLDNCRVLFPELSFILLHLLRMIDFMFENVRILMKNTDAAKRDGKEPLLLLTLKYKHTF